MQGRIESMREAGGVFHITISYNRDPLARANEYEAFKEHMKTELETNGRHIVFMPIEVDAIFLREND
jgi:hypothetical protein